MSVEGPREQLLARFEFQELGVRDCTEEGGGLDRVWRVRRESERSEFGRFVQYCLWKGNREVQVAAAYKRKAQKVRPVDRPQGDGSRPGGDADWKDKLFDEARLKMQKGPFDHWLTPKFSEIPRGSRLTAERVGKLIIGPDLTPQEKELLIEMLYYREAALAFDFTHCGRIRKEVAPPQVIKTVIHKAWQAKGFPIPRALTGVVADMLRDRIKAGVLEHCDGPYRNPYFLVKKKEGKYRLINNAIEYNRYTVRDAGLPPAPDEFAEEFAGLAISSLIDFFSGYDQVTLAEESRDLTAFMTMLGLLRMTTLPQGATNSVAQFVRIVTKILGDLIPDICRPFLDDIGVKGPRTRYKDKEVAPGIRQFVLEHIRNLDRVLVAIELAGGTIGPKSQWCMDGVVVVGFVCGSDGRSPVSSKVIKILDWPPCTDLTSTRAFLGVCVYYRLWIPRFGEIAEPIYRLSRKGVDFNWGTEQQLAMDALKLALTTAPALAQIDYAEGAGPIILAVDSSLKGWGAVLMQEVAKSRRHPSRYESGLWNKVEQNYDATKLECRGVLKALKKVRFWLYGVHFILETDANVLVAQLNRSGTDLPGALVTRWLAWIRLFDFEVRHVPGHRHTAADGLSRRPRGESDEVDEEQEVDIDDFVEVELSALRIAPVSIEELSDSRSREEVSTGDLGTVLEGEYSAESYEIARYLTTLKKRFQVQDRTLFKRAGKNTPQTRVIDSMEERALILKRLHDETGHKGRESTYRKVADRYFWGSCYFDVKTYCQTCPECQLRDNTRLEEALYPRRCTR